MAQFPAYCRVLSDIANDSISFFALVDVLNPNDPTGTSVYVLYCGIGVEYIHFFRQQFSSEKKSLRISYNDISRIQLDLRTDDSFSLVFKSDVKIRGAKELFFRCPYRMELIGFLECAYQIYFIMYTSKNVLPPRNITQLDPNIRSMKRKSHSSSFSQSFDASMRLPILPNLAPFIDYKFAFSDGYYFLVHDKYTERIVGTQVLRGSGSFVHRESDDLIQVEVCRAASLEDLVLDESKADLRNIVSHHLNMLRQKLPTLVVIEGGMFIKKMNLTDDRASWSGHWITVSHEEGGVCMIVLRRQYVPPLMDTFQDIILTMFTNRIGEEEHLLEELSLAASSAMAASPHHVVYRDLLQCRIDALLASPEDLAWFGIRQRLFPLIFSRCRQLIKLLVDCMMQNSTFTPSKDFVYHLSRTKFDPTELEEREFFSSIGDFVQNFVKVHFIEANCEGICLDANIRTHRIRSSWHRRLAEYLGFLLAGGLGGKDLSLETIVKSIAEADASSAKLIHLLIAYCLHIREADVTIPFSTDTTMLQALESLALAIIPPRASPFAIARVTTRELGTGKYLKAFYPLAEFHTGAKVWTLSNSFLSKLLATDYFETYVLAASGKFNDVGEVALIRDKLEIIFCESASVAQPVKRELFEKFLRWDLLGRPENSSVRLAFVVPAAAAVLKYCHDHEIVLTSNLSRTVVAVLVNLSAGSDEMKLVLANSAVPDIVCQLLFKWRKVDVKILAMVVRLTRNLIKHTMHRGRLITTGILPAMLNILAALHKETRNQQIISFCAEVSAVACQLTLDPLAFEVITQRLPSLDFVLAIYMNADEVKLHDRECIMLHHGLRILAEVDPRLQLRIGKHAIPRIILRLKFDCLDNVEYCFISLSLLTVLVQHRQNCEELNSLWKWEEVKEQLEKAHSPYPKREKLIAQLKSISDIIHKTLTNKTFEVSGWNQRSSASMIGAASSSSSRATMGGGSVSSNNMGGGGLSSSGSQPQGGTTTKSRAPPPISSKSATIIS